MTVNMDLGMCYRVVFSDDTSLEFRFLGFTPDGKRLIESPPDHGGRQVLQRDDFKDFYEIDSPREEMEMRGDD